MILLLGYGIGLLAIDFVLAAVWISVFAVIVAMISFMSWRRIWTKGPEWLLFTADGVASRHTEGTLHIIPWLTFKRVTVQQLFSVRRKRAGVGTWEIRLFREPRLTLLDPTKHRGILAGDRSGGEIAFRVNVTEADATRIVNRLRECFTRGWAGQPQQNNSVNQTPTAAAP